MSKTGEVDNVVNLRDWAEARKAKAAERTPTDTEARRLMRVADDIDQVILKHLHGGEIEARDLAGLLAHRLGTLMRHMDEKSELWDVCQRVLKGQAAIE
jgi:hypothetical protein